MFICTYVHLSMRMNILNMNIYCFVLLQLCLHHSRMPHCVFIDNFLKLEMSVRETEKQFLIANYEFRREKFCCSLTATSLLVLPLRSQGQLESDRFLLFSFMSLSQKFERFINTLLENTFYKLIFVLNHHFLSYFYYTI